MKQYWLPDFEANKAFFSELAAAGVQLFGNRIGVYTNKNGWTEIFGSEWTGGAHLPLWWAHWDKQGPSWDSWVPFAGWKTMVMKQYHGGTYVCDMHVDLDSY